MQPKVYLTPRDTNQAYKTVVLYPEEGSIAEPSVKTFKITASVLQIYNLQNRLTDKS